MCRKNFHFLFIQVLLLVLTLHITESEAVVGGDAVHSGNFNYTVNVLIGSTRECTGSILSKRFVVTAAHCVAKTLAITANFIIVIAGTNDKYNLENTAIYRIVDRVYIPTKFHLLTLHADIAILRLKTPLPIKNGIRLSKLKLPKPNDLYFGYANVTGFGVDTKLDEPYDTNNIPGKSGFMGKTSGKMRVAETEVLARDVCQRKYRKRFMKIFFKNKIDISADVICAKLTKSRTRHAGICRGDSGGPLVHNENILMGVTSFSSGICDDFKSPGVYTRVSSYLDFIRKAKEHINDRTIIFKDMVTNIILPSSLKNRDKPLKQ